MLDGCRFSCRLCMLVIFMLPIMLVALEVLPSTPTELRAYQIYNEAVASHATDAAGAAAGYMAALALKPDLLEALNNLGDVCSRLGDAECEERSHRELLRIAERNGGRPDMVAAAYNNLGLLHFRSSRHDTASISEAIALYDRALMKDPEHAGTSYNKASALQALGRRGEALELLETVLQRDPSHVGARTNLGNLYLTLGDYESAAWHHETAVALSESSVDVLSPQVRDVEQLIDALNNLGQTRKGRLDHDGALSAHERALALDPDRAGTVVLVAVAHRSLCSWRGWEARNLLVLRSVVAALARFEAGAPLVAPGSLRPEAFPLLPYDALLVPERPCGHNGKRWLRRVAEAAARPWAGVTRIRLPRRMVQRDKAGLVSRRTAALRLGYLSCDLNEHPMGHLTHGLLVNHNRSRFVVSAYSYGPEDGSAQRARIERTVTTRGGVFRRLRMLPDKNAAATIASDGTDVLFDLMAHTRHARLGITAQRPAPVVINYLGYPGSSGHRDPPPPTVAWCGGSETENSDLVHSLYYAAVDRSVLPVETSSSEFTERLLYLPHAYQANEYNMTVPLCDGSAGAVELAACLTRDRKDSAPELHPGSTVLCSLNTLTKLEPVIFSTWMGVMRRVPRSELWLLPPKGAVHAARIEVRLRAEAAARGIAPWRLVFAQRMSKADHLSRMRFCDFFVDSFWYGAHTTAADALWAGVPLLAHDSPFSSFPSRVGASLLGALGLRTVLGAPNLGAFETTATRVASDVVLRRGLRRALGSRLIRQPLFSASATTQAVEAAAHAAWDLLVVARDRQAVCHTQATNFHHVQVPNGAQPNADADTALLHSAITAHRAGDTKGAEASYLRLVSADTENAEAWHLLGVAAHATGDIASSVRRFERAVALHPTVALYHSDSSHARLDAGDASMAAVHLRAALESDSTTQGQRCEFALRLVEISATAADHKAVLRDGDILLSACKGSAANLARGAELAAMAHRAGGNYRAALEAAQWASSLEPDSAKRLYFEGAVAAEAGEHETALARHTQAVRMENTADFERTGSKIPRVPRVANRRVVVIYCHEYGQAWWPRWGPSSPESGGVGGSEEAAIFLARELVARGAFVEIYADPPDHEVGTAPDGVVWYPHTAYDSAATGDDAPDVFVAWRYHISLALGVSARARFLWLQDMAPHLSTQLVEGSEFVAAINGIFVLSRFHLAALPAVAQRVAVVTPNALDPRYFVEGANKANELVYASAPNRGLEQVLRMWGRIRSGVPNAVLRVYYGFTESFLSWGREHLPNFEAWLHRMERLLEQDGVHYIGKVDHLTLAQAYAKAGFTLYPTSYPETGCIAIMKAQALGAVPITSRYHRSTLPELAGLWDLGPEEPAGGGTIAEDQEWLEAWADAVVGAIRSDQLIIREHRRRMIAWARSELLWSSVAEKWEAVFQAV